MYIQAAMAVGSMVAAHSKQKAAIKAAVEDAKLQRARMEQARTNRASDYSINTQRAREAAQKRDIQIEKNRVQSESKIDETFAGSGISGTSLDELDAELNAAVANNKYENKKSLDDSLTDMARSNLQAAENDKFEAVNIGSGPSDLSMTEQLAAGAEGYSQGANLASAAKDKGYDINGFISKKLGF